MRVHPIFDLLTPAFLARFWHKAIVSKDENACWLWIGDRNCRKGYGRLKHGDNQLRAPRVALTIKLGRDIRPGMQAQHTCDRPECVNPKHLVEGTVQFNKLFEVSAKRHAHGERVAGSRLTEADVREVLSQLAAGVGRGGIASTFGVSTDTIGDIERGRTWRHVTGKGRVRIKHAPLPIEAMRSIADAHFQGQPLVELAAQHGISLKLAREVARGEGLGQREVDAQ